MTNRPIIGEMEARKLPTRQDKDGNFIISFSVHPDDAKAKPDLLTAAPGTPFAVRYCMVDYDNPEPEAPKPKRERVPFDEMKPSQQAGILCADPEFWEYLETRHGSGMWKITGEEGAAHCVRNMCFVESRSELDTKTTAAQYWNATVNGFRAFQTEHRYSGNLEREAGKHG